ncbi:MAG: tetratricopeptide repeat protein [Candidatus Omnitrophota bacterium]
MDSLVDSSGKRRRYVAACLVALMAAVSCAPLNGGVRRTSRSYSAYLKGLLTDRMGSFEEAAVHYRTAQKLDQKSPSPRFQLGLDYIGLKDFKKAEEEFQAVLRLDPDDENARYVLALVYAQLSDHQKAAEQYEILLKSAASLPQQTQLRRILSQLYFLAGDNAAAARHGEKILQMNPLDQDALYFMGLMSSEEGRADEAAGYFKKVLEYYPQDWDAMNSLAFLYAEKGVQLGEALDMATRVVTEEPDNGAYLDTLGWVYFKLGDAPQAIVWLEKAARIMVDPVILNHLAEVYEAQGNLGKARTLRQTSLALDPSQKDIRKKLLQGVK